MQDLVARLGVSPATIRRDLAELSDAGLVRRVHGGAAPPSAVEIDRPYEEVADDAATAKRAIARRAAELVREGDTVLLDIGTTTGALAHELRGRRVTVVTPSLAVLDELRGDPVVDVVVLGGFLRRAYHSLVGPLTEEALRRVRASTVFLGASGIDAEGWVLDTTSVEVPTKRGLLEASGRIVLLADHTKFPGQGSIRVCDFRSVSVLITTALADPRTLDVARAHGTEVVLVEDEPSPPAAGPPRTVTHRPPLARQPTPATVHPHREGVPMNHHPSQDDRRRQPLRRTVVLALATSVAMVGAAACDRASTSESSPTQNAGAKDVALTITSNSIAGGKNADEADWYEKFVIPTFTKQQAAKGVTVKVTFQPSGVDDEQYKTKVALDLKSKAGADIMALDGIWVGEFAQAGYIKPLTDVVGADVTSWEGWAQIPKAVQANVSFEDKTYGIPAGTDGRILYFNKKLFAQAGLPADWQPKSWQDILDAGTKLKAISGVNPVQINAGTAMGEATTMQGVLPLLVGAGAEIYSDGKWQGDTKAIREVLTFYKALLDQGLESKNFQQAAKGRDQSFAAFADGKVGILLEGDYFWRSVINPKNGDAPMATRDADVGWAFIPAREPGSGVGGTDNVSMSGGGGYFLNPNTKYPQQAWELLQFLGSADAINALLDGSAKVTARQDVNAKVLSSDPLLSFVSEKVLPVTHYRPGLADLPAGLAGAAAGDRRHRLGQERRRGRQDVCRCRREGGRRCGQGGLIVTTAGHPPLQGEAGAR